MTDIAEGYTALFRTSPFLDLVGPFYQREEGDGLVVALRIEARHANARGTAHGGLLVTMADVALGYNAAYLDLEKQPGAAPAALTTANLSVDFAGSAKVGDWVEARVDVQRVGGRLAFANAYLYVGERRIARASAVFAVAPLKTANG